MKQTTGKRMEPVSPSFPAAVAEQRSRRVEFLTALFRILEGRSIPYCVLRNYHNIYEDTSSDVDLAVEPEELARLKQALDDAAQHSGYSFIHQACYINYSYVYWHPQAGF